MPWTCPYCLRVHQNYLSRDDSNHLVQGTELGQISLGVSSYACGNDTCKKLTLKVTLKQTIKVETGPPPQTGLSRPTLKGVTEKQKIIKEWALLPDGHSKPFPSVPKNILQDYEEACKTLPLSPKASATLSRRCLQGMIRDFCKINDKTLYSEIEALRKAVNSGQGPAGVLPDVLDAIDAVRKVGNVGAHMERDTDLIIDVDQGEAEALINLIELLFKEWYEQKAQRTKNIEQAIAAAQAVDAKKKT